MLRLNTIRAHDGATHRRKRLGRGPGSGRGQTAGKGDKGQLARSGGTSRPGFEGGQMPLYRRIPKRGFKNPGRRTTAEINLVVLQKLPSEMKEISLETLIRAGILRGKYDRLAILGSGEINRAFQIKAHRISGSAEKKVINAGGKIEKLPVPGPRPRVKKNRAVQSAPQANA